MPQLVAALAVATIAPMLMVTAASVSQSGEPATGKTSPTAALKATFLWDSADHGKDIWTATLTASAPSSSTNALPIGLWLYDGSAPPTGFPDRDSENWTD